MQVTRGTRRRSTGRGAVVALVVDVLTRLTSGWWTVDELADDLRVSRRTVWRVLRELRRAGLDVQAERRDADTRARSYRLPARWWEA